METREIKTTVALAGEKEFRAAISESTRALKIMGAELKLNTAEYQKSGASMDNLTSKRDILTRQIAQEEEHIRALTKAVEDSSKRYGENHKHTDGFREQLVKSQTALTAMERDLIANEKAIDGFGTETTDADKKTGQWRETLAKVGETLAKGVVAGAKAAAAAIGTVAVAAGAAAVKLGKEVIREFGELEQNLGGADAVFGQYADAIKKHGEDAYKNMGASQSQYLATANKMGALFQGSGIEQQKSLDLTAKAMQRAADMASVMGIDTQVALDSIAGAAKGNFTMMDNLGVAMNATSIQAYAVAKGMDFVWSSASQAEKAEVAMQMFFENTEQYAGNFARESTETITGSLGMMQAATSSFVAGLGDANADMTKLTKNIVDSFQAVVKNVEPVLRNIVASLPVVVGALTESLGGMLPVLIDVVVDLFTQVLDTLMGLLPTLIPVVMEAVSTITTALVAHLPEITAMAVLLVTEFVQFIISNLPLLITAAVDMIVALVDGITSALPMIIPAAMEGIITFVTTLMDNFPKILETGLEMLVALAKGIIDAIPRMVRMLPQIIRAYIDYLTGNLDVIIQMGIEMLVALTQGVLGAIPELLAAMPEIIAAVVGGLVRGLGQIAQVGVNMVKGLWEGIKNTTTWLWNKLKGWINDALGWIGKLLGISSPSKVMRDKIGLNIGKGMAEGITDSAKYVDRAMDDLMPDTNVALDVTRRFNNAASSAVSPSRTRTGTVSLSEEAVAMLARAFRAAVSDQGDVILTINDREFGRAVRKAVPAV